MPMPPVVAVRDAGAFLTRLPVGLADGEDPGRQTRALAAFPVVGALIGLLVGVVRLVAELGVPAGPATLLGLVAGLVVTGALHEDGLADAADGLGAYGDRARRLEIMRDSRIGTYGALAVVAWFVLAWSLLAALDGDDALRATVVAGALGRWTAVLHARALPPARADGLAARLRPGSAPVVIASLAAVAVTLAVGGPGGGGAALATAALLAALLAVGVRRAFGGATGDTHGASTKLVEVGVYLVLVAVWAPA
jgi:adenosylcobinamide-GDP ribazoletransferase